MSKNTLCSKRNACIHEDNINKPYNYGNLFINRFEILSKMLSEGFRAGRTYEKPERNYLLVFYPFNRYKPVDSDLQKIEKYCRTKFKYSRILITREYLDSPKTHYNVIVTTKYDCILLNRTNIPKFNYKLDVQILPGIKDVRRALLYIIKESKRRDLINDLDRFMYVKNINKKGDSLPTPEFRLSDTESEDTILEPAF